FVGTPGNGPRRASGGSDLGRGGKDTRAGIPAAGDEASVASTRSIGCAYLVGLSPASASAIRRNWPTATPSAIMMRPPTAAVVPALIRVFPKLNSLIGIPNPTITSPATRANVPTLNSNTAILYDPLSTSNFCRSFPAKLFWQRQILAFSKAGGNH